MIRRSRQDVVDREKLNDRRRAAIEADEGRGGLVETSSGDMRTHASGGSEKHANDDPCQGDLPRAGTRLARSPKDLTNTLACGDLI
jgi:hypothetical protein